MSERIHLLAQRLFNRSSVEQCDLQEIRDLVYRFPYFAPAQFLLLQKMKQENHADYHAQLQKAVLYYQDPIAFEYFISSEKFYTDATDYEWKHQADETRETFHEPTTTANETIEADVNEHADINAEVKFIAEQDPENRSHDYAESTATIHQVENFADSAGASVGEPGNDSNEELKDEGPPMPERLTEIRDLPVQTNFSIQPANSTGRHSCVRTISHSRLFCFAGYQTFAGRSSKR